MLIRQQEAEGRRLAVEQLALEVKAKQEATELRKTAVGCQSQQQGMWASREVDGKSSHVC